MNTGNDDPEGVQRVLLVGFMGSGKTTAGRLLAARLGWEFLDQDAAVEARAGCTIPALFRERGERAFRDLEEQVARRLLERARVVLATGGGWPCRPGRLEAIGPRSLSVWLKVEPETALRRVRSGGGGRPLLEVPDPERRASRLLDERTPYYRSADLHVETENRTPPEVVAEILRAMDREPGMPIEE